MEIKRTPKTLEAIEEDVKALSETSKEMIKKEITFYGQQFKAAKENGDAKQANVWSEGIKRLKGLL